MADRLVSVTAQSMYGGSVLFVLDNLPALFSTTASFFRSDLLPVVLLLCPVYALNRRVRRVEEQDCSDGRLPAFSLLSFLPYPFLSFSDLVCRRLHLLRASILSPLMNHPRPARYLAWLPLKISLSKFGCNVSDLFCLFFSMMWSIKTLEVWVLFFSFFSWVLFSGSVFFLVFFSSIPPPTPSTPHISLPLYRR